MFVYCSATTKSGKPCVNSPKKHSNFCGIHQNQYQRTVNRYWEEAEDDEIMDALGLKSLELTN